MTIPNTAPTGSLLALQRLQMQFAKKDDGIDREIFKQLGIEEDNQQPGPKKSENYSVGQLSGGTTVNSVQQSPELSGKSSTAPDKQPEISYKVKLLMQELQEQKGNSDSKPG